MITGKEFVVAGLRRCQFTAYSKRGGCQNGDVTIRALLQHYVGLTIFFILLRSTFVSSSTRFQTIYNLTYWWYVTLHLVQTTVHTMNYDTILTIIIDLRIPNKTKWPLCPGRNAVERGIGLRGRGGCRRGYVTMCFSLIEHDYPFCARNMILGRLRSYFSEFCLLK